MPDYKLPDVGEGLTEAELVSWKVKVGDTIAINDVVCEIETAKSIVELPSPYAGTVSAILVNEGETIPVGTPIITIGDGSEAPAPAASPSSDEIDLSNPAASGSGEGESLVGRMKAEKGAVRRARTRRGGLEEVGRQKAKATVQDTFNVGAPKQLDQVDELVGKLVVEPSSPAETGDVTVPAESAPTGGAERPLAKPPVRKLAKDLGVDLATLAGSGEGGVITRDDVQAAATGSSAASSGSEGPVRAQPSRSGERETREPIKGVRKMMAQAMVGSAFSAPHVTEWVTFDATKTMEFVEALKGKREFKDLKVSPLLVVAKACLLAMRRTPEINSFWDDAAQEVVYKNYCNLGIAAATPRGLVVPNVKDADAMSLTELASALGRLTATAREGKTQPADMSGGTFTITNVGVFGVDAGTPIINPGESAILCVGAITKKPWVVGDEIAVRHVTTLALSFDHRHIDGALGSQFLADVAGILEDPATALMF